MGKRPPITGLLNRLAAGEDAYTDVFNHFVQRARNYASKYISTSIQSRTSATSVAHTALCECLAKARKGELQFATHDGFWDELRRIVRSRAKDAARKSTAKKRDVRRTKPMVSDSGEAGLEIEATDLGGLDELKVKLVHNILQEPDEIRRTICILGILCNWSPKPIRDAITPLWVEHLQENPKKKGAPPSVRTIQIIIAARKKHILDELGSGDAA